MTLIRRFFLIEDQEWRPTVLSFAYFFFLLCGYFVLRPLREEMAVRNGVENLGYLYSGTFLVMFLLIPVFGWLVSRFPKRVFLPASSIFFTVNLLGFWALFAVGWESPWLPRIFYVWLSVFNLFVVSVFWSLMVDLFKQGQAKRLFPIIAAGGTIGAVIGPQLTLQLIAIVGIANLFAVAAGLLFSALICQFLLVSRLDHNRPGYQRPMGGSVWAGLKTIIRQPYLRGVAIVLLGYPLLNTFFYFHQIELAEQFFPDSDARVSFFAWVDFGASSIAAVCQFGLTARLLRWIGAARTLVIMPIVTLLGFILIAANSLPLVFGLIQAIRRGGEYGLMKPARELLFTVVDDESKYKAKNVIDTFVYRGGDVVSAWMRQGLTTIGFTASGIALFALPFAGVWAVVAYRAGQSFEEQTGSDREQGREPAPAA